MLPLTLEVFSSFVPQYAIIILERMRARGKAGIFQSILIGLLFQTLGGGITVTLYWLVYLRDFGSGGLLERRVDARVTYSVCAGILFGQILPSIAVVTTRNLRLLALWQFFPLWVGLAQYGFLRIIPAKPHILPNDKKHAIAINILGVLVFAFAFVSHTRLVVGIMNGPQPLYTAYHTFLMTFSMPSRGSASLYSAVLQFIQVDLFFITFSFYLGLLWTFDRVGGGKWKIALATVLGTVFVGPGATSMAMWMIREARWETHRKV